MEALGLPSWHLNMETSDSIFPSSPVPRWLFLQVKANPSMWPLPPPQETLALLIIPSTSFTPSFPPLDLSWQHVNIFISALLKNSLLPSTVCSLLAIAPSLSSKAKFVKFTHSHCLCFQFPFTWRSTAIWQTSSAGQGNCSPRSLVTST